MTVAKVILVHDDGSFQLMEPDRYLKLEEIAQLATETAEPKEMKRQSVPREEDDEPRAPERDVVVEIGSPENPSTEGSHMNHKPSVRIAWYRGATPKGVPIHVGVFGSGMYTIADHKREAWIQFTSFDSDESTKYKCQHCKSVGKAKGRCRELAEQWIESLETDRPSTTNAEMMELDFSQAVPSIDFSGQKFHFRSKRSRREASVALLTYKCGDEMIEVRIWRARTGSYRLIFMHIDNGQVRGWKDETSPKSRFGDFRTLAMDLPPLVDLDWVGDEAKYGRLSFRVINGADPKTSQLMATRRKTEFAVQCGPRKELMAKALLFLTQYDKAKEEARRTTAKTQTTAKVPDAGTAATPSPVAAAKKTAEKETSAQPKAAKKTAPKAAKKTTAKKATAKKATAKKATAKKATAKKATAKKAATSKKATAKKAANDTKEAASDTPKAANGTARNPEDALADGKPLAPALAENIRSALDELGDGE